MDQEVQLKQAHLPDCDCGDIYLDTTAVPLDSRPNFSIDFVFSPHWLDCILKGWACLVKW